MSFLDDLKKALLEQLDPFPGSPVTPAQQKKGPTTKDVLGFAVPNPQGTETSKVITSSAGTITSVADFLSWIAWIFHPLNLLRAVEFLTGLLLFWMGLRPYLDRSGRYIGATGAGISRTVRRTISATPVGREMRASQGRRMGTREGQREAARMQARQEVTRPQREASARERVRIQRQARQSP